MRYIQHGLEEKKEPEKKKAPKEEKILAGSKDYDYYELGKMKPLKGGNPYGR